MGSLCGKDSDTTITYAKSESKGFSKKNMIGIKTYSINKDYEILRSLGFGSYGEVKLGKHRKTGRDVAIKKIPLMNIS